MLAPKRRALELVWPSESTSQDLMDLFLPSRLSPLLSYVVSVKGYRFDIKGFYFFIFSSFNCTLCVTFSAQPAGVPEILKKSLHSCSVAGGEEVFIIGKNFLKGTKVLFQENSTGTARMDILYHKKTITLYWVLA